jgi:hypothetical protein
VEAEAEVQGLKTRGKEGIIKVLLTKGAPAEGFV